MYEDILNKIIDDMQNFAIISTIAITEDCYSKMSKKEIQHLDSFLCPEEGLKWLILNDDRKDFFYFIYAHEPMLVKGDNNPFNMDF